MLSEPKPQSIPSVPCRVHVAIFEHRHGTDVRVFRDEEGALAWRTAIARKWWNDAFEGDPPPDDQIGKEYFDRMSERDEFFSIEAYEVETECPVADDSDQDDEG